MEKIDGHQYELVVKDQNGGKSLGELLTYMINTHAKLSKPSFRFAWA